MSKGPVLDSNDMEPRLACEPAKLRGRLNASLWRLHLTWRPFLQGEIEAVYQEDKSNAVLETHFDKWNIQVKVSRRLAVFTDVTFCNCVTVEAENVFTCALGETRGECFSSFILRRVLFWGDYWCIIASLTTTIILIMYSNIWAVIWIQSALESSITYVKVTLMFWKSGEKHGWWGDLE